MKICRVIGHVWATKKEERLEGLNGTICLLMRLLSQLLIILRLDRKLNEPEG